jgi:NADH dehydrogenase FAD-containing subunit
MSTDIAEERFPVALTGDIMPQRILILGGGFAGVNTAMHLERLLAHRPDVQVTLVSRDNYSLFTPMLAAESSRVTS